MRGLFFTLVFVFSAFVEHYAADKLKYGKLSKAELQYDECSYDPEAVAVFLNHQGEISVSSHSVLIKRHIRIKILKESGTKYANINIPYYAKDGYEKIYSIKAQTINQSPDGKFAYLEVDKKNMFDADLSDEWKEKRFTFPGVKVGSILEYEYLISSENHLYLDHWSFQQELPTLFASLHVEIPQYLDYRLLMQGYRLIGKYKEESTNFWELTDLPAIKKEPFLYNQMDFVEMIQFQLSGYHIKKDLGGTEYKSLRRSWESLADEILSSHEYRSYLNKSGYAKGILSSMKFEGASPEEKMQHLYSYVAANYPWNGKYRRFTYNKLSDISTRSEAHSSEINLLLTLLLNEAGIEAFPMLISTRSNGVYMKEYPFLTQFNHLIVYAKIGEKEFFFDALDPLRPYDVLPVEDHIVEGFVLDKKNPRWQAIHTPKNSKEVHNVVLSLSDDEVIDAELQVESTGLFAVNHRRKIQGSGENKWMESLMKPSLDMSKDSGVVVNYNEADRVLSAKVGFSYKNNLTAGTGTVYVNPFILNKLDENPFNIDTRNFPVQFPYKQSLMYVCNMVLPENYELVELPAPQRIKLPNGYGSFSYLTSNIGRNITVQVVFSIDELEVPVVHYANLKEFYNIIISRLSQPVVIRKTAR